MRAVDVYTVTPWGLYMARPTPGRVQFHYLESWLLPSFGLRVNVFHFNAGHEREQDYYLDVGEFTAGDYVWRAEDHYLDIVTQVGRSTELLDVDELLDAHHHGLVSSRTAERAIQRAVYAITGLAENNHDVARWLARNDMQLTWAGA